MTRKTAQAVAFLLGSTILLSACEEGQLPAFMRSGGGDTTPRAAGETRLVERDVEAPEVFQATDSGLWDGRPSLGGVWVAHSDAKDPERVIIRNEANGKFVIGALFRRERAQPGPKFQVSSDAADALGMLAGSPVQLNVTALRREEVADPSAAPTEELDAPSDIEAAPLDDTGTPDNPIAAAAAALDEVEAASGAAPAPSAAPAPRPAPAPAAAPAASSLAKPFVQIGIFSVEGNAANTAESLRRAGMVPTIKPGSSSGKAFWRVVVGPATSSSERSAILRQIKALGFADAYYVTH